MNRTRSQAQRAKSPLSGPPHFPHDDTTTTTISSTSPSYPLLRMTCVAMLNLSVAYASLVKLPTLFVHLQGHEDQQKSNQTLPSLSWTLVILFGFQTAIGLMQAHLAAGLARDNKGSASASTSASLLSVFNVSISIGAIGTLICHVFAVLFGAGILHQAKETMQLAGYLSLLTFYPASFVLGTDFDRWYRIFILNRPQTYTEAAFYCQGTMTIFGAWLGSIVIPLDWDRPWQAWPVPCVLGAFMWYCIGTIVGFVASMMMRQQAARQEFGIDGVQGKGRKVKTT